MLKNMIRFFATQHLFSNFFFLAIFLGGLIFWELTPKEELPAMTFDTVRVSVAYSGASAKEVEYFVTIPLEKELGGIDGIKSIQSTSSQGSSSISVELEKNLPNRENLISEIRNAANRTKLPSEITDLPQVREFKTSRKAIIDIALYFEKEDLLDKKTRGKLQKYALTLENKLLTIPEVNSVNRSGYLQNELQVLLNPRKLRQYRISAAQVMNEIRNSSIRQPAGTLENREETRITINGELDTRERLEELVVQGGFEGNFIRLRQIASIENSFEETNRVIKVNGREAIILNVVKNSSYGILDAVDAVEKNVNEFSRGLSDQLGLRIKLLDDESRDVRNRLSIIGSNSIIGFGLILIMLFLFLNFRAGFWVAMGIPFTFCFTLIAANLLGYTINNITLAAVIIVMGMIVDDAIVVSENIIRLRSQGMSPIKAAVEGTAKVLLPVTASILTTIVAFLPLLAFEGRLSILTDSIPPIISLMLLASLVEALFILPAHMSLHIPRWAQNVLSLGIIPLKKKLFQKPENKDETLSTHWFHRVEERYGRFLAKILRFHWIVILFFIFFMAGSFILFTSEMKFSLFPREEATQVYLTAKAPEGTTRYETAKRARDLEKIFIPYVGKELVGFRTSVGSSRYRDARENYLRMRIELVNADAREKTLNQLQREWEAKLPGVKGFEEIEFSRGRFGSSSGSAVEVLVQENDAEVRDKAATMLAESLGKMPDISTVEIDRPYESPEYILSFKRDLIRRLGISASDAASTLRTMVNGTLLYELLDNQEEMEVRLSAPDEIKRDLETLLATPVHNQAGYLVPMKSIVSVRKERTPSEIQRIDGQRILRVYANLELAQKKNLKKGRAPKEMPGKMQKLNLLKKRPPIIRTPLEIADYLEAQVFPEIRAKYPGTLFSFEGEIKMSRESTGFFQWGILLAIFSIYIILALQFNSLNRPLNVLMIIFPAVSSVIFVFWVHGMATYGFFGIVGALGLSGVVVNDTIILLNKLDGSYSGFKDIFSTRAEIAQITSTRLRAVVLTTLTTVAGLIPTAYGFTGYDSMLAEMMLALAWGLVFGTLITLVLIPSVYCFQKQFAHKIKTAVQKRMSA
jgi:multidrug efflux pump subunit AcrB